MSDIAVRVENLGKSYQIGQAKSGDFRSSFSSWMDNLWGRSNGKLAEDKDFWALNDINFEIKKGEAVGIIGRNGAGKSTLLKILSRITEPTKGRFEINGRVSSLLEVGTGFHPELSGRENIYLNGTILGMKRREIKSKFDEIIDFSGVEKFIDTPVKHYSSGMKVRLAFSVAAHLEPEILIIDEVLAVGDVEFQKKCLGKMDEVSKGEGRTVIFVSHNMGAVKKLCNSGVLLKDGHLIKQSDMESVISEYLIWGEGYEGKYIPEFVKEDIDVAFQHVLIKNKENKVDIDFTVEDSIYVEFKFHIKKEAHPYYLFVIIKDKYDNAISSKEVKIENEQLVLKLKPGFLTRGTYCITTFIHIPRIKQVDIARDICHFTLTDNTSELSIHGNFDYGNVFANAEWI